MAVVSTRPAFRNGADPVSLGAALLAGKKVPPDVTLLLTQDHREAMAYFDWYRHAEDRATRTVVARKLCAALRAHMQAEEDIFYPAMREATGAQDLLDHAIDEHAEARELVERIEAGLAEGGSIDDMVERLQAAIEEHVSEEEGELFPKARDSGCDLFELGSRVAARKVAVLLQLTGRAAPGSEDLQESEKMPIDEKEAESLFVAGLRDVHASLRQGLEMAERQTERLKNYPQVKERLQAHRDEKAMQLECVEDVLDSLGVSRSAFKDMTMEMAGNLASAMNAMTEDEVLKNSLANFGLVNFNIASFEALLVLGAAAGHDEAVKRLQVALSKERAMASWLAENQRGLILMHLQHRSEGRQASH